jgi:hypothetical protein
VWQEAARELRQRRARKQALSEQWEEERARRWKAVSNGMLAPPN